MTIRPFLQELKSEFLRALKVYVHFALYLSMAAFFLLTITLLLLLMEENIVKPIYNFFVNHAMI